MKINREYLRALVAGRFNARKKYVFSKDAIEKDYWHWKVQYYTHEIYRELQKEGKSLRDLKDFT